MTTRETPDDSHEQVGGSDSAAHPPVGTGPGRNRRFNRRSRWLLIGGPVAGAVVAAVIVVVILILGGGSGGPSAALELIPNNTEVVFVLDVESIQDRRTDFPGDYDNFADELQYEIERNLDTEEIGLDQVTHFVFAADRYLGDIMLLLGQFAYGHIRADWEDRGFEEDSYRSYEVWDGYDNYALLEGKRAIIASHSEEQIREVVKNVDRGVGSLASNMDNDLARIFAQLGASPVVIAFAGDSAGSCGAAVSGCVGYGAAFVEADMDREEVEVDLVLLFSSERRAERAIDEYDDLHYLMESVLGNLSREVVDFPGLPDVVDVDIYEITADGEFALASGVIEIEVDE